MSANEVMRENIVAMNKLHGFSVVIICCSNEKLAAYWQQRLESGKGTFLPLDTVIVSVFEDWVGGAGNALGTLYAFKKASVIAAEKHGMDLSALLMAGTVSVGLFHTAGKGTRLAPLPAAENNNKPGVKLPATIILNNKRVPITILESVIKQTGCYAASRMGRLSVFWGDQIFIPTVPVAYTATHHVDILCSLGPMMSEDQWKEKGMDKYGLIAQCANGKAAQVEKVDHSTALRLLSNLGAEITSVGVSLGSFSLSAAMLVALNTEFAPEVTAKEGKMDSDPHLWMPMTLAKDAYVSLMEQKKVPAEVSASHYDRIASMMSRFECGDMGLFGGCDVGMDICWWDYGQVKFYARNTMLMTERNEEADLMRSFFQSCSANVDEHSAIASGVTVDETSCVVASTVVGGGSVKNSVLCNVHCNHIEADGCILMNITADRIVAAPGSILYNILGSDAAANTACTTNKADDVSVGVFSADGAQMILESGLSFDGGVWWDKCAKDNKFTFGEMYARNAETDPTYLEGYIASAQDTLWKSLGK